MQVQVLECPAGTGQGPRATAVLVDEDLLIDAGAGLGEMSLEQMIGVREVFITDTRMDHIGYLPLMVDTVFGLNRATIRVHAPPAVVANLRRHVFNWHVWPDFLQFMDRGRPVLDLVEMNPGSVWREHASRSVEMLDVGPQASGVAYRVSDGGATLVYASDMRLGETFWAALREGPAVDLLVLEDRIPAADPRPGGISRHALDKQLRALKHAELCLAGEQGRGEYRRLLGDDAGEQRKPAHTTG